MNKIIQMNKPKRQWDSVQKYWYCPRCEKEWTKDHAEKCEWYQELKNYAKKGGVK